MLTIYAEKEAFENIVVFNDSSPNWYNIFCNHSYVCLNMTDEEILSEEIQGTPIFEYILANGGKSPIALKDFFDSIYEDISIIAEKPRSVFFLKYNKIEAESIQAAYGVIVQSIQSIDDNLLTGSYKQKLLKDEIYEEGNQMGWNALIKYKFPPSNAIVISDSYLLTSTELIENQYIQSGKQNTIWLLNAILPATLKIEYHITIISDDNNLSQQWRLQIVENLTIEINKLRDYKINVEVVFLKSEHFHERIILMNYVIASCDRGFNVFKVKDGKSIHSVNKLSINGLFTSLINHTGDSEFETSTKELLLIRNECEKLAKHLRSRSNVYHGAVLGGCRANMALKNRLVNDA